MTEGEIRNRVAESALTQICPEDWYDLRPRHSLDLADFLFQGLVLRELDFRAALKEKDWAQFKDGILTVFCSTDAIIPVWAYMLTAVHATPFAEVFFCRPENLDALLFDRKIQGMDFSSFEGKRVIVKGCSRHPVPDSAFLALTARLQPLVQSLMFGEPCSNVPLYKRKKVQHG